LNCVEQLKRFLESPDWYRSEWLDDGRMKRYVRRGARVLGEPARLMTTLELANSGVEPRYQRQGLYKGFNEAAERLNPYEALYVENVLEVWLRAYYERNGWTRIDGTHGWPPSYYKLNLKVIKEKEGRAGSSPLPSCCDVP
jgi:GNAT superfamily N-acetyltransferase